MRYPWLWPALFALASAANAAEVGPCDTLDSVGHLVGQPKSFVEGKIRIAHVDTYGEPVCCSSHLLVFIPAAEGEGPHSECFAVSQQKTGGASPLGFRDIAFSRIAASYDPQRGLLLSVPYTRYDAGTDRESPGIFKVRIDLRGPGAVGIER